MPEIGEELVGAWLRVIAECDFVQYNVPLRDKQGEIDVIGLNLASETAYICEVATHLGGLQYVNVKDNRPDNVNRLTVKFQSDVEYARRYLHDFHHQFMLWSPIVIHPRSESAKYNQFEDLRSIRWNLWDSHQAHVQMVVNELYLARLRELREAAGKETAASEYPVFRLLQIFEQLQHHVDKLQARGIDSQKLLEA
jgi:hypothetical protein